MLDPWRYEHEYASSASRVAYVLAFVVNPIALGVHLSLFAVLPGMFRVAYASGVAVFVIVVLAGVRPVRIIHRPDTRTLTVKNLCTSCAIPVDDVRSIEFRFRPRWTWLTPDFYFLGSYCLIAEDPTTRERTVVPIAATISAWGKQSTFDEMLAFFERCELPVTVTRAPRARGR